MSRAHRSSLRGSVHWSVSGRHLRSYPVNTLHVSCSVNAHIHVQSCLHQLHSSPHVPISRLTGFSLCVVVLHSPEVTAGKGQLRSLCHVTAGSSHCLDGYSPFLLRWVSNARQGTCSYPEQILTATLGSRQAA